MAEDIEVMTIYALCPVCWGTGVTRQSNPTGDQGSPHENVEIVCPNCGGKKFIFGGYVCDDKTTIPDPEVVTP